MHKQLEHLDLQMERHYAFCMLTEEEIIRFSLLAARKDYNVEAIAKKLGCNRKTVGAFLTGGKLSETFLERAKDFARHEGFWLPDLMGLGPSIFWESAARDLSHTASVILDPVFTDDEKTSRFTKLINFYQSVFETHATESKRNPD